MRNITLCSLILLFVLTAKVLPQNLSTSLIDIYMGNYGFWDYQSTGSIQAVEQDTTSPQIFHAVYLRADSSLLNPLRRIYYFYSSNGGNNWVNTVVANVDSYYPSLALQDGRAIVCFYDSTNDRIRLYRTASPGSLTFDTLPSPPGTAGTDPKSLFYRNYLILFAVSGNQLQKNRYSFITNSWGTWQAVGSANGTGSYQIAKGWGGRMGACWIGDSTLKIVKYSESLDSGNTFGGTNVIFTQEITGGDTVKAFSHVDMVYYQNQPCVVWDAIARILPLGGQPGIRKFYHNPRIYFWNPPTGLRLVADSSNYGGSFLPGRNFQISMGANWSTIAGPSIGVSGAFSPQYMYILFSAAKTNVAFGNFWYDSDIFIKFSQNGGTNWYTYFPQLQDDVNDDRFVNVVKNNRPSFGYNFALTMQKDRFPGSFRAGDTTAITRAWPEFFYITVFIHTVNEQSEPDEYDLCPAYPNPFNNFTRIEFWLPKKSRVLIEVYNLVGQKVETLVDGIASVGSSLTVFDGTNRASGVYIARMFVEGRYISLDKLVLVK